MIYIIVFYGFSIIKEKQFCFQYSYLALLISVQNSE